MHSGSISSCVSQPHSFSFKLCCLHFDHHAQFILPFRTLLHLDRNPHSELHFNATWLLTLSISEALSNVTLTSKQLWLTCADCFASNAELPPPQWIIHNVNISVLRENNNCRRHWSMLGAQREAARLPTAASLVLSDGSDVFQSQVALNHRERACGKRSTSSSKGRS